MSRAALALPSVEAWSLLGDKVRLAQSTAGPEQFDVLAYGTVAADRALRVAVEQSERVRALVLAAAEPPTDRALAEHIAALKAPVLALFGTRDAAVPPETARKWRTLWPGCHIVFVYDAGSDIARDRPEAFVEVVLDFLAEPGAFLVNRSSGVRQP